MNLADLAITISLPPIPPGWFDFGYAVLFDGSLALVRTDRDVFADDDRFIWDGHIRISTFDGRIESEAITLSAGNWPLVDRLPDGRWIVVASRADPTEKNARLSAGDGSPAGAFALGDGVQDIRCAKDGAIWVSYFDEGIFANQNDDGSWPIGSAGIVQCDPEGGVL